jgi:hypothetical protein
VVGGHTLRRRSGSCIRAHATNLNLKKQLSEDVGGVAEFGGDSISVGRAEYSVELERSRDVCWICGSPSRTLVRRQPTSFDWPESDVFKASSSISLLAITSCRLDFVTLS